MQFTPYLNFDGDCAAAMAFYAQLFGGHIEHMSRFGDMPPGEGMPPLPETARERVMHAQLRVGEQLLMASDALPAAAFDDPERCAGVYRRPQGLWISIGVASVEEGRRVFDGLAEGGSVTMPFAPTFWSPGFGMVTDRFGTPWMINVTPAP
jgi:PhnB protein